jgi:hypothetical protein
MWNGGTALILGNRWNKLQTRPGRGDKEKMICHYKESNICLQFVITPQKPNSNNSKTYTINSTCFHRCVSCQQLYWSSIWTLCQTPQLRPCKGGVRTLNGMKIPPARTAIPDWKRHNDCSSYFNLKPKQHADCAKQRAQNVCNKAAVLKLRSNYATDVKFQVLAAASMNFSLLGFTAA